MMLELWGELMPCVNAFYAILMNGLSNTRRSRRLQKQRDVIFLSTKGEQKDQVIIINAYFVNGHMFSGTFQKRGFKI
jgi:hypothetical protein